MNKSAVTYESICEKLGFDFDTFEPPPVPDYEYDGPDLDWFKGLSSEELDFLLERRMKWLKEKGIIE